MKERPKQINFQADDEMIEDIKVLAARRGQTLSELIRRTLDQELQQEANRQVQFS